MSLARDKITRAVEAKGYRVVEMTWEPWGRAAEKEGIPGGWEVYIEPVPENGIFWNPLMGLSWQEVVEWIEEFVPALEIAA